MEFRKMATCLLLLSAAAGARAESDAAQLVHWLLSDNRKLDEIPFSEVIHAATGHRILPLDRADGATARVLREIGVAADATLLEINRPGSAAREAERINEASQFIVEAMRQHLDATEGLACGFPKTAEGRVQLTGYPDLRVVDKASGTVYYIDPKLYATDARDSSFRTFYFTPKIETNKVLEDAHHLILGVAHDSVQGDPRKFLRWELIDLSGFHVRLKAEFEGSNHDMYRPEAVVSGGGIAP